MYFGRPMHSRCRTLLRHSFWLLVACSNSIHAQPAQMEPSAKASRTVQVPVFDQSPVIDGSLEDTIWKKALVLKDFYQIQPRDNTPPSKPTTILLGYDTKNLYVGFDVLDDPGKVRFNIAKRDAIFEDDNVRILLDTFNDKRRAYILAFNPLGIQADGILTEGSADDYTVDVVMSSKGRITDTGYSVEVAIPFRSIQYEPGHNRVWGMHVVRESHRLNKEVDSWMPVSRDRSGLLSQEGHIVFDKLPNDRTIEVIPTVALSETGKRTQVLPAAGVTDGIPERFMNAAPRVAGGATVKIGLSPMTTLAVALNPDFAEVEADQTVVLANQRFPIFFPEKRPFFLEGQEIFQTPLPTVHTRAVIDPDIAVKFVGRGRRTAAGLLFASDNGPGNFSQEERDDPIQREPIENFIGKNALIAVIRLKRNLGQENHVGLVFTGYTFGKRDAIGTAGESQAPLERHSLLGGIDGRLRLNQQTFFTFQVVGSMSRRYFPAPELDPVAYPHGRYRRGNGLGYYYSYENKGRHFTFALDGQGRTRDYRADVGFELRTNTNNANSLIGYTSTPKPKARLVSWTLNNIAFINFDWQARMQNWHINPTLSFSLARQSSLAFYVFKGYERLFEEEFGPQRTATQEGAFAGKDPERSAYYRGAGVKIESSPTERYSVFLNSYYGWGDLDFDFGGGPKFPRVSPAALVDPNAPLDPGPGRRWHLSSNVTYQPVNALRFSLDFTKDRLVRNDTRRVAFDDKIFALRATYQFTRFTFSRVRIDYDSLTSNVRGQLLFGWTPRPGTSVYVGYDDDLNVSGFNPFTGLREPGLQRNARRFFLKVSYLIRRGF